MLTIKASLPLLSGLFYLYVSGVDWYYGLCRGWPTPSSFRNVLFSCQLCVMITYGIDFTISILSNLDIQSPLSTAQTIYTGGSLLLWIIFVSATRTSLRFVSLKRQGCWVVYGVSETVFIARHLSVETDKTISTVISMFRLGCLYTLCSLPLSPGATGLSSKQNKLPSDDPSIWGTLRYLLPFFWPAGNAKFQILLVGYIIGLFFQRWVHAVFPMKQGHIYRRFTEGNDYVYSDIFWYIFWEVVTRLGHQLTEVMWIPVENRIQGIFPSLTLRQLMNQSADFHNSRSLVSRWELVTRAATGVHELFKKPFFQRGPLYIDICVAAFMLLRLFGVQIVFIIAVGMAISVSSYNEMTRRSLVARRYSMSTWEHYTSETSEIVQHRSLIASFGRIAYELDRASRMHQKAMQAKFYHQLWSKLQLIVDTVVINAGFLQVLLLVAYRIQSGELPPEHLVTFLNYWRQLTSHFMTLTRSFNTASVDAIMTNRVVKLMQTTPTIIDRPRALPLKVKWGRVVFNSVSFSYIKDQQLLQDISFTCEPGQIIAIVGKTGGGKSTILSLLRRSYDVQSGSITIDGQDIREVTIESVRSAIAPVEQEPEMLKRTIMENLRYGNPDVSQDHVYQVCKDVQIHNKLSRIGYNQIVGEDGVKLSGGERQRVAIARAILKGSRIFLFDEATSQIDTVTEGNIQAKLVPRLKNCTTLVVSHRPSTIKHANKIVVIEEGKIVQHGTHEELKEHGLYGEMWARQRDSTKDEPSDI